MMEPELFGFSAEVTAIAFDPYFTARKTDFPITAVALS
jgi:hypothetical protein